MKLKINIMRAMNTAGLNLAFKALVVVFALSQTACKVETKIRDTFVDRTAPDAVTSVTWLNSSEAAFTGDHTTDTSMIASWTPSSSTDTTAQKIQFYSDAICTTPSGPMIALTDKSANRHAFTASSDGTFSFKVFSLDRKNNQSASECASAITVDNTAPTIAITVPANGGYINLASDSSDYQVSGTCSEEGRTVTILNGSGGSATPIGQALCTGGTFNTRTASMVTNAVDSTQLSVGSSLFTATITDLASNETTSSAVSVTRDVLAPANATALVWKDSSDQLISGNRHSSAAIKAAWTVSNSGDLASQSIQFYSDGACSIESGTSIALSSTVATQSFSGADGGVYSYKVTTVDLAGNASTTPCSSSMEIDTSVPTVTITTAVEWINNANKIAYTVSGNCADLGTGLANGGAVTVTMSDGATTKTATPAPICTAGTYTTTFDTAAATAISEGVNHVTVTATVTDLAGNTVSATQNNRSKDTVAPSLSITSTSHATWINSANVANFTVSGTCTEETSGINGNITVTMKDAATPTNNTLTQDVPCAVGGAFTATFNATSLMDGTSNITITAAVIDVAGNSTTATTTRSKDTVAPTSAMVFASNGLNWEDKNVASTTLTSSNCTDQSKVMFTTTNSAPTVSDGAWVNCVTTAGAFTRTLSSPSEGGAEVFYAWSKDAADNISASKTLTLTFDTTAPTVSTLVINNGDTITGNNNTLAEINASSTRNDIWAFCLKYNDTAVPALSSTCWTTTDNVIGSATTQNLNLTGASRYSYRVGAILNSYAVRLWVRDAAGNISVMSNSGNGTEHQDLDTIQYNPDPPPVISNAIVSNTDSPTFPLTAAQTTAAVGTPIFIRWNASDNNVFPAGPIKLEYTTDENTYTTIATGLSATGSNSTACTVDVSSPGCYQWTAPGSPLATFYKIRISATDSGVSTVVTHTNAMNTGSVNFLTGNTSLGIDGSANSAIFVGKNESTYNDAHDNGALAVTKTGIIFFKFNNTTKYNNSNGYDLVYVDPATGILKTLMKYTGTSSANGNAPGGTLKSLSRIALDYRGNLLIWDHTLIRRIDLSSTPWQVKTLADISLTSIEYPLFTSAPNGRIYYEQGNRIKFLKPTDSTWNDFTMDSGLPLTGLGAAVNTGMTAASAALYNNEICPTHQFYGMGFDKANTDPDVSGFTKLIRRANYVNDRADCGSIASPTQNSGITSNFNPVAGVAESPHPPNLNWSSTTFTGMDGKLYSLRQGRFAVDVYNPATNTFDLALGNGFSNGRCVDGTLSNACPIIAMSAFVDEYGTIFFNDMGVIRFKDKDGKIQTLAGQPRNFGEGQNPLSARYSMINVFDVDTSNQDLYVSNRLERKLVKFNLSTGSNLSLVAGNGSGSFGANGDVATAKDISTTNGWATPTAFKIDAARRRLYHSSTDSPQKYRITYIDLNTGKWVVESSPATIQDASVRIGYVGIDPSTGTLLMNTQSHYGSSGITDFRTWVPGDASAPDFYGKGTSIAYSNSSSNNLCALVSPSIPANTCELRTDINGIYQTQISYSGSTYGWLMLYRNSNYFTYVGADGYINRFNHTANAILAYDYRLDGSTHTIYYCSTSGILYKKTFTTAQIGSSGAGTEVQLPLPANSGMRCDGNAMLYNSYRNSLMFIYNQNGLYGIAEYVNP